MPSIGCPHSFMLIALHSRHLLVEVCTVARSHDLEVQMEAAQQRMHREQPKVLIYSVADPQADAVPEPEGEDFKRQCMCCCPTC